MHYSVVKPHCSNFRIITSDLFGCPNFLIFMDICFFVFYRIPPLSQTASNSSRELSAHRSRPHPWRNSSFLSRRHNIRICPWRQHIFHLPFTTNHFWCWIFHANQTIFWQHRISTDTCCFEYAHQHSADWLIPVRCLTMGLGRTIH